MQNRKIGQKRSGFTLIEMGIVMVIIALIVSGVMAGQTLIQAATVKATIAQIEEYQTAFNNFADRFQAWPGDFARAEEFLGVSDIDGNGNTLIEWGVDGGGGAGYLEGPLAWYHLQLAGLVNGQFGAAGPLADDDAQPNVSIPPSRIGGEGAGYSMNNDGTAGGIGNYLMLGLFGGSGTGINDEPIISPITANDIDRKLDDSFPESGLVRAQHASANDCYDSGTPAEYQLTKEDNLCWLWYKLD